MTQCPSGPIANPCSVQRMRPSRGSVWWQPAAAAHLTRYRAVSGDTRAAAGAVARHAVAREGALHDVGRLVALPLAAAAVGRRLAVGEQARRRARPAQAVLLAVLARVARRVLTARIGHARIDPVGAEVGIEATRGVVVRLTVAPVAEAGIRPAAATVAAGAAAAGTSGAAAAAAR